MEYSIPRAIYLQLADSLCDQILQGLYQPGARLPSVRELAAEAQVNPNTMLRTVSHLVDQEILVNQRGVGTFVSAVAREKIMEHRKQQFLQEELNRFFHTIQLLGLSFQDLQSHWELWLNRKEEHHENQH